MQPAAADAATALRAAGLTLAACLFFAAATACAKAAQLDGAVPPQQVTFFRYLFGLVTLAPLIATARVPVFTTRAPGLHAVRVACGVGGVFCMFAALGRLPLGDASAIAWANPLVAMLFAALVFGERVTRGRWLFAALGFAGVLVMMRPSGAAFGPGGLIALAAALLIGAEVATIRVLGQRDGALTVLLIANAGGTVASFALAAPVLAAPDAFKWAMLAGTGGLMVSGQLLFMAAMRLRETAFVAPFSYATLVFAFGIGIVVFAETPDMWSYVGAVAIAASGIAVTAQGLRAGRRI